MLMIPFREIETRAFAVANCTWRSRSGLIASNHARVVSETACGLAVVPARLGDAVPLNF